MSDQPLQPFGSPNVFGQLNNFGITLPALVQWTLYLIFFFWVVYTIVAVYHWLKYSHASWIAFPAIALHIFISFCLMVYTLTGTRIV